jgi:hypothetical protein
MSAVRLTLILFSSAAIVACGTRVGDSGSAPSAGSDDGHAQSDLAAAAQGPLEECQVPHVLVVPATLPLQSVDRSVAERQAGAYGATGAAAIALPALVTVGIDFGSPPTAGRLLIDGQNSPISARPAWALVFRGQSIPRPALKGMTRRPPPTTTLAAIIDARTGRPLRGWGCGGPAY